MRDLPQLGQPPRERADAARNRARLLAVAERLFAERGVGGVTMDDIAREAGVGKGTLYRRFTDKSGLAIALLDARERELQEQILRGRPPLGAGAPPVDRLVGFVRGYLEFLESQLDLVLMAETATVGARSHSGAHQFWTLHCRTLLEQAGRTDPGLTADVVMAALAAEQVRHWRRDDGIAIDQLGDYLERLVRSIASARDS